MQGTNTNTILIVIFTLIIVAFGSYWYKTRVADKPQNDGGASLQINLGGDAGDKPNDN